MSHRCHNLIIGSYNCRGFNCSKIQFLQQVMNNLDILFIQEHWLNESRFTEFSNISKEFSFSAVCGMDNKEILKGRPYGGCAILWRSNLTGKIELIESSSRRLCAVKYQTPSFNLLLINVYLPYECDENSDEFFDQLVCIETLISSNLDCNLIIGGDCNIDFCRITPHTALLDSFCANNALKIACRHKASSVDFTYHFSMSRFSVLDHFLVSCALFDMIEAVTVCHSVDNLSDHEPITIKFGLPARCSPVEHGPHPSKRCSWVKATSEQLMLYQSELRNSLSCIHLPYDALLCNKLSCTCIAHTEQLERYAASIISDCSKAALRTVPVATDSTSSTKSRTAGWSEFVKPAREKSLFWHNLWMQNGRPRTGAVADCMRRTRAAYHYSIRQVRRNKENLTRQNIGDSFLNNNMRDFWLEIKKIRRSKNNISSHNVDGCCTTTDIAN